ncbi:hypothetical protein HWV00_05590 [Moritella sp. 24]|uniref:PKD domain-containing protein n=1 Tax=Moritella sp. 24 TaxID=2746230 RepID=UPI001BA85206|nr:hypothetical protein [Moritella sp. 24]QUM75744.1 hypothetical protein HWV00_05590 [Moritella sp. 24]
MFINKIVSMSTRVSVPFYVVTIALTSISLMLAPLYLMANEVEANLIQAFDTSNYPSPDTAGIVYLPSEDSLLITDSEINEMAIFPNSKVNVFKIDRNSGSLLDSYSTISFSDEPTGITINTSNQHCFISDDTGTKTVYEIDPGNDGVCLTSDDIVTSFSTSDFNSSDPEDVSYGLSSLFIVDGVTDTVYRVAPGANGLFDGVAVDDQVTSFNTSSLGIINPEGIHYDITTNNLYIVGTPRDLIIQTTIDGQLVRSIDISIIDAKKPSGLTIAPSSLDSAVNSLFLTARGVDNDSDPNENDGMVYELELPPFTIGNESPVSTAGADQSITMPHSATLTGSVSDDGLPDGTLTISWTSISGEGDATFTDANDPQAMVSFSMAGDYVLRLTASDGELQSFDDVTISVAIQDGVYVLSRRIEVSSDDAEELDTGKVRTTSSDLELVYDGSDQTVGLRFNNINIPQGATIVNAYIQFQTDEVKSVETSLIIQGERSDNAELFLKDYGNISSRPRTTASVAWNPDPWLFVGEAGINQKTSNIQPIITEIINQDGWASGNSLAIIITGTGERVAESYNGEQDGSPLLYVEYSYTPGNEPPIVSAGPDQLIIIPNSAILEGSVSDDEIPDNTLTMSWSKISGEGDVTFTETNGPQTTASFSMAGDYVLRLTASDGELQDFDDVAITVTQEGIQVLSQRIEASTDDAEEKADGRVKRTSSDLELVYDGSNQIIGMRFNNISIPQGATIVNAYIQFQTDEVKSVDTALTIQGERSENAGTFLKESGNISSRPLTTALVAWAPDSWGTVGEANHKQKTSDISTLITEVTGQSGWVSGNSLVIIITGTGERIAESYDGDQYGAPLIYVEYTLND